jgi:ferritin-like protein
VGSFSTRAYLPERVSRHLPIIYLGVAGQLCYTRAVDDLTKYRSGAGDAHEGLAHQIFRIMVSREARQWSTGMIAINGAKYSPNA